MRELKGKTVLVTGAASGIGKETALAFAREGCTLLLADINETGLEEVAESLRAMGTPCKTYPVDVASAQQVEGLADRVLEEFGAVDVLANVAGVCAVADTVDTPLETWEWIMGVNLWGPIHTIHFFLPSMIQRKSGHIVNVASAAGLIGFGFLGAYVTTKFGLVGLGEALGQEVRQRNVKVTTVCPGLTNTPILGHMRFHGYSGEKVSRYTGSMLARSLSPARLAEMTVEGVKRGRPIVAPMSVRVLYLLKRISPRLVNFLLASGKPLIARLYR